MLPLPHYERIKFITLRSSTAATPHPSCIRTHAVGLVPLLPIPDPRIQIL